MSSKTRTCKTCGEKTGEFVVRRWGGKNTYFCLDCMAMVGSRKRKMAERDKKVAELRLQGLPITIISRRLGVSTDAIKDSLGRSGIGYEGNSEQEEYAMFFANEGD